LRSSRPTFGKKEDQEKGESERYVPSLKGEKNGPKISPHKIQVHQKRTKGDGIKQSNCYSTKKPLYKLRKTQKRKDTPKNSSKTHALPGGSLFWTGGKRTGNTHALQNEPYRTGNTIQPSNSTPNVLTVSKDRPANYIIPDGLQN